MAKFFGVFYKELLLGKSGLCEVDGGVCYEAYRNKSDAEQSAQRSNASAEWHSKRYNHEITSEYFVDVIPDGIKVFDSLTNAVVITSNKTYEPKKI